MNIYRRTFETERPKGASFQNVGGNLVANLNGVPFQMRNGVIEKFSESENFHDIFIPVKIPMHLEYPNQYHYIVYIASNTPNKKYWVLR
jgi:hypothetical protein